MPVFEIVILVRFIVSIQLAHTLKKKSNFGGSHIPAAWKVANHTSLLVSVAFAGSSAGSRLGTYMMACKLVSPTYVKEWGSESQEQKAASLYLLPLSEYHKLGRDQCTPKHSCTLLSPLKSVGIEGCKFCLAWHYMLGIGPAASLKFSYHSVGWTSFKNLYWTLLVGCENLFQILSSFLIGWSTETRRPACICKWGVDDWSYLWRSKKSTPQIKSEVLTIVPNQNPESCIWYFYVFLII